MSNNQELLEKIEYLRDNADVGYEEALTLLERYDGDMTRVLVELERQNRIRSHAKKNCKRPEFRHEDWHAESSAYYADKRRRHHENVNRLVNVLFHKGIMVSKNDRVVVNLPVAFYIGALIFAPHLTFFSLALIFVTGCHINGVTSQPRDARASVNEFVNNAAHNVRATFDSVTTTIKNNEFRGEAKANGEKAGGGDDGEYTV